jgi:hypothetical protein
MFDSERPELVFEKYSSQKKVWKDVVEWQFF